MRLIPASLKKELIARSGNRCAFPNCGVFLFTDDGILWGNICHIEAIANGGPRYNPNKSTEELSGPDNLIVLCPNHHVIIDAQPYVYTSEWLRRAKASHEKNIEQAISQSTLPSVPINKPSAVSFRESLMVWEQNRANGNEEFWQNFLSENPRIIAQAIPNHILKLGQKCYLGGKSIENKGGNVIDFLYVTNSNKNVVLVEIKTPLTRLVGSQYRANAYSLTEEFSGAIVQVLNYRDELLKNYYSLCGQDQALKFSAFNPQCLIIAGNLELENLNGIQRKSIELFRSSSNVVQIVTFDELFGKVKDLVDITG